MLARSPFRNAVLVRASVGDQIYDQNASGRAMFPEFDAHGFQRFVINVDATSHVTNAAGKLPGFLNAGVVGKHMREVLAPESLALWNKTFADADASDGIWLTLSFLTPEKMLLPSACMVLMMADGSLLLYCISDMTCLKADLSSAPARAQNTVERLHDYILNRLGEPLPKLKLLAREFGVNEHTLNDVFREKYGLPIYKYYTRERLDKAMLLIKDSSLALNAIASSCGFPTYGVFSKAFRKRFGVAPSGVQKSPNS